MRKILFITGTHGNEAFAVRVLERIENTYSRDEYGYDWIIGNRVRPDAQGQGIATQLRRDFLAHLLNKNILKVL